MASPINSSFELRYSVGNLVREQADLDYVNQKLLNSGYTYTRIDCVTTGKPITVVPTTEHPSPCRAEVPHADDTVSDTSETLEQTVFSSSLPESNLDLSSPDSDILCRSPDCPIKDIPHNIGRYFHNGEQYQIPSAPGYQGTLAGIMKEVSNMFNRTIPPPEVVAAYINIRTCAEEPTKADLDLVRNYQKHHMWSPINSEPTTPWPRDQYPHMHGLHGRMPRGNKRYIASDGVTSLFDQNLGVWSADAADEPVHFNGLGSFSFELEGKRPLLASDFEDSDDEDYVPFPPVRAPASDESSTRPLLSPVTARSDNQSYDSDDEISHSQDTLYGPNNNSYMSLSTMREVPQGHELMSEKLRLQEQILRQMADDALEQTEEGKEGSDQRGNKELCRPSYASHDIEIEILLELMEALPQALDKGGVQPVLLDEEQNDKGFSDAELWVLSDVQLMLQREFQAMISNAKLPYVPTGLPVTPAQLRGKLSDIMVGRQEVLKISAGESISEIVEHFF